MLRLQLRGAALRGVRAQLGVLQASVAGEAVSVSAAEHELIEAACRGMARHAAAHAAVAEEEGAAPAVALLALARTVKDCREAADAMRARGAGFVPPKVSLPSAAECRAATQLPLFGRMRRDGDVEFHAGTPPPPPFLRPLSLSAVPRGVISPHEVAPCPYMAHSAWAWRTTQCIAWCITRCITQCIMRCITSRTTCLTR